MAGKSFFHLYKIIRHMLRFCYITPPFPSCLSSCPLKQITMPVPSCAPFNHPRPIHQCRSGKSRERLKSNSKHPSGRGKCSDLDEKVRRAFEQPILAQDRWRCVCRHRDPNAARPRSCKDIKPLVRTDGRDLPYGCSACRPKSRSDCSRAGIALLELRRCHADSPLDGIVVRT